MAHVPFQSNQPADALEAELLLLRHQQQQQRAVLEAARSIDQAVQPQSSLKDTLAAVHQQLCAVFSFDSCCIGLCYAGQTHELRATLSGSPDQWDYAEHSALPPLVEHLLQQQVPILVRDAAAMPVAGVPPVGSWMGTPLSSGSSLIGVMLLHSRLAEQYNTVDFELFQQLGSIVALALARVYHTDIARRRASEMELVYRIAAVLGSRIDQQEILDLASQELVRLFWADHTGTVLFDDDLQWGTVVAEYPPRSAMGIRIRLTDNQLVDELIATRRPVVITSTKSDPRAAASRETFRRLGIVSIAVVPLINRDRVIGSISLDSFTPRQFSEEERELFLSIAASIATAVENARLFTQLHNHATATERHAQRLELVNRIALVLSGRLDVQDVLSLAARELVRLFWADHTGIVLFDEHQQWGTVVAEYPESGTIGMRIPIVGNPVAEEAVATGQPVCIPSVATDPRTVLVRDDLQRIGLVSMMIVPLISRGKAIGSIGLDSFDESRIFTEDERELFVTVAASVAAAVENARLFAAEQEARQTADTLREVARVLSSSFDPAEVLHLILRELQRVVLYDTASIMLIDGKWLRIAACQGWSGAGMPRGLSFPIDDCSAGQVVRQRQTIVIPDTEQEPAWTRRNIGAHIRSWLGVPLIAKGTVLGVLNIDSHHPNHFGERDLAVAQVFANQAAVALENARLYQESVTRVEQELAIARSIQNNLFPRSLPQIAGITLAARCVPARETGGDFYDVVQLGERRLALMVGDVSGKSIPAAMLMAVARSITRSEARDHETPPDVMCETNRWIVRDVPRRTFVALAYATLDMDRRRLALANAGQLTPLLFRADGSVTYLEPPEPRLPLGVLPNVAYAALEMPLVPGDLLVFYTDGIVEAQNSDQDLFGFERFEALIHACRDVSPSELIDHVMHAIQAFAGSTPQHDDITLLVVRVDA